LGATGTEMPLIEVVAGSRAGGASVGVVAAEVMLPPPSHRMRSASNTQGTWKVQLTTWALIFLSFFTSLTHGLPGK